MTEIKLLSQETIDKIAAGEVIERPSSVVKELCENAIDAGASLITVETEGGGTKLIRVTDNGTGIPKEQVRSAFLRHSTSKLRSAGELDFIKTLGFRGEALSSIAAVSETEIVTKTTNSDVGTRYVIEGGKESILEDVASSDGTSFFVRNLFYNTPARRKFLKSETTENNYIEELITRLSLSNPDIAFTFIANGRDRIKTTGNGNLKDTVFSVYGKEVYKELLPVSYEGENVVIKGVVGTPGLNRGNRNYESFFVQGRYVHSRLLERAVEEGYTGFLMQHQYPFCVLFFEFPAGEVDVNVHPTKMEVRFSHEKELYCAVSDMVHDALSVREDVKEVKFYDEPKPFEPGLPLSAEDKKESVDNKVDVRQYEPVPFTEEKDIIPVKTESFKPVTEYDFDKDFGKQMTLKEDAVFKNERNLPDFKYIGQVFGTYVIIEFEDKMYLIDQHAAHEKVLFEETMKNIKDHTVTSQNLMPSIVVTLTGAEMDFLFENEESFSSIGYEFERFGGKEVRINAVPANLYSIDVKQFFLDMIAQCSEIRGKNADTLITERVASLSCKAAIKGNSYLSPAEVHELIGKLLTLDNPYHCPHGRPTIITMSKYELDKKFKRIV